MKGPEPNPSLIHRCILHKKYTVDAKNLLNYPPYIHLKTQNQSTSKNISAPNIDRQKRQRTTSSWKKVLYTAPCWSKASPSMWANTEPARPGVEQGRVGGSPHDVSSPVLDFPRFSQAFLLRFQPMSTLGAMKTPN